MTQPGPGQPAGANASSSGSAADVASTTRSSTVNIEALADRVYRLMLADIGLQRRRAGGGPRGS